MMRARILTSLGACFGVELLAQRLVAVGEVRERPGSVAWQLSSSAAGSGCGIRQRPRRASTIARAWSKSTSEARQGSQWTPDSDGSSAASFPVAPTRGNERAAAVWKHHEQQQSAAALYGAHNRQCAAFKRMPLTPYRY